MKVFSMYSMRNISNLILYMYLKLISLLSNPTLRYISSESIYLPKLCGPRILRPWVLVVLI